MSRRRRLAPLSEEPSVDGEEGGTGNASKKEVRSWSSWIKNHIPLLSHRKSDVKMLLGVLGCPLSPVSAAPTDQHIGDRVVESQAQYIVEQFAAATGCRKMAGSTRSAFVSGKVRVEMGAGVDGSAGEPESGCFVMWQMDPGMWLLELVVSGQKVVAGSDGRVAWRHTPWFGAHAARGGARPLRRTLQGLDPVTMVSVFSTAQYMGERRIFEEDCFLLKVAANHSTLMERSDNVAEIIKHVMVGYFSQRTGLLLYLEDSQLTRIQASGALPTYWDTTIRSKMGSYRAVDGVVIAHSGCSTAYLVRFGDCVSTSSLITQMEEEWTINDIVFNVHGLSIDCFIPPEDVRQECSEHAT